jgi:hypothetical protein
MSAEEVKADTQGSGAREALERFVVENDELLTLESLIGRFNIFDALGIARAEIRHSNFLAFILDPAESHGQGQLFLKAILMDLLKNAPADKRPLSPIDLDGTDLRGVEVKREWNNIDLLITGKEPRFAVVIENKVGAQDHSNQLNRYSRTIRKSYPDQKALYVYLTPDGDDPSEETEVPWLSYTYAEIHRVFQRTRETYKNAIGDDVLVFMDHYLNLLGTRFMNDEELDELCRKIYKNHRQALDLIWERVGGPEATAFVEVANVVEQDPRWHVLYRSSRYIEFVPKACLEWLPPFVTGESYPLFVHTRWKETDLAFAVFVGLMQDAQKRTEIITKLREATPGLGFRRSKAYKMERKWCPISGIERFLQWGEDDLPEPDAIRVSVKKMLDDLYPKLENLALVLKPLCNPASK